jgi:hypothetical protein
MTLWTLQTVHLNLDNSSWTVQYLNMDFSTETPRRIPEVHTPQFRAFFSAERRCSLSFTSTRRPAHLQARKFRFQWDEISLFGRQEDLAVEGRCPNFWFQDDFASAMASRNSDEYRLDCDNSLSSAPTTALVVVRRLGTFFSCGVDSYLPRF